MIDMFWAALSLRGARGVLDGAYSRYRRSIYITEIWIADASDSMREGHLVGYLDAIQMAVALGGTRARGRAVIEYDSG